MNELDEAWALELARAEARARAAGRTDISEYLALRRSNDLIRKSAGKWLLEMFTIAAGEAHRTGAAIKISTEDAYRFKVGNANLVGSRLSLKSGVRMLSVEVGWPRLCHKTANLLARRRRQTRAPLPTATRRNRARSRFRASRSGSTNAISSRLRRWQAGPFQRSACGRDAVLRIHPGRQANGWSNLLPAERQPHRLCASIYGFARQALAYSQSDGLDCAQFEIEIRVLTGFT